MEAEIIAMLTRDHARMRAAGTALAEAALYTVREYDGLHRLALAVAEWAKAVADEGDRGLRANSPAPPLPELCGLCGRIERERCSTCIIDLARLSALPTTTSQE